MAIEWNGLTFVLNALWQVPLAAAVGLAGDRLLRRAPARLRHLLWLAVLGVSMILPLAAGFGSLLPRPTVRAAAAPVVAPAPAAPPKAAPEKAWRAALPAPEQRLPAGAAMVGTGLWAAITLAFGFRLGRAWLRARRLVRRARPLEIPDAFLPLLDRCRAALDVRCEILGSSDLPGPVTVGAWRPVILLPSRFFDTASPEEAAAALGHEMAHIRRRDYAVSLLCEALLLPIAFHPAARLLRRRVTETREMACDEVVVSGLVRRQAYARSLLALAAAGAGLPRPSTTLGALDAHTLEVRMKRILDTRPRTGIRPARAALGAALLLLGGAGLLASGLSVHALAAEPHTLPADTGGGDLTPFVGTWRGTLNDALVLNLEIRPDGKMQEHRYWYATNEDGTGPWHLVQKTFSVSHYEIKGPTLRYTARTWVDAADRGPYPEGVVDAESALQLVGDGQGVLYARPNSNLQGMQSRGIPVPPPFPPLQMKRQP